MKAIREENGQFSAYAWPGGYPVYYLVADNGILCPTCANTESSVREAETRPDYPDYDQWRIVTSDINWENPDLFCDHCNERIESAYAEKD